MLNTDILSNRTKNMKENIIREILKVVSKPGMVSLAGGIPSPDSFPMKLFPKLLKRVTKNYNSTAFQYSETEGFPPLKYELKKILKLEGINTTESNIVVTSGSQGALDSIGKILINKGDIVAVESPTYLGALSAFNPYEPQYLNIQSDENGIIPASLDEILSNNIVKFIYLVPTFQNPTGKSIPLHRREEIARIILRHKALLVEDDPYSRLRYSGNSMPPISSFIPENSIYISTLSKVFAPGLRLGYFVAPLIIKKWMTLAKQGTDLHTSTLNQALATEYLKGNYMDKQIDKILELYKPRQLAMLNSLEKYMPKEFSWTKPEGGMFIWVTCPRHINTYEINLLAIKQGIAFVPGEVFFSSENTGRNTLRLNFTMITPKEIDNAIKKLAYIFNCLP